MLWDIHSTCRLCHAVYGFIFIEHLRVVLFFHLDICQKFAHIGIPECKHIGIIRSGHHFFRTNAVCSKEIIVFLIFRIGHGIICCLWLIHLSIPVIDVAGRDTAFHDLFQRLHMLLLLFFQIGKQIPKHRSFASCP